MPVALETSKRKFQSLLDNLTTGSPPSESSTGPSTQDGSPSTKRTRVTLRAVHANQTVPSDLHTPTKSVAGKTIAAGAKRLPSGETTPKRDPPNYTPWSHELFLKRLKTFSDLRKWTSKPDAVNEVQWAKRGWVCDDVNTVACRGGCEQRIVVVLRPPRKNENNKDIEGSEDYSLEVDEEVVRRFAELIVTGHGESCLWKGAGCKDDIYRLPMARPTIWQPQLQERYASFANVASPLDLQVLTCPTDINKILEVLKADFFSSTSSAENADVSANPTTENGNPGDASTGEIYAPKPYQADLLAFSFALFGWYGSEEGSGNEIATCEACFRRIGLWLYSGQRADQIRGSSMGDETSDDAMKLDLIQNHRDYCPWVNADSQSMPGSFAGLAGWEILQRVIMNSGSRATDKSLPDPPIEDTSVEEPRPTTSKAKDAEKADKIRFARLKELTKAMSFKTLKKKSTKDKAIS